MNQEIVLKHEFVEFIPGDLKAGTIYISTRFGTAVVLLPVANEAVSVRHDPFELLKALSGGSRIVKTLRR
jgi:hypothetical protein